MRLQRSLITILALLNKRPKIMLVVENTYNIHLKVLCVPSFCHWSASSSSLPSLSSTVLKGFNWIQDSSELIFFTPCQTWFLPHLQLHDPSLNFSICNDGFSRALASSKNAFAICAGRYVLAMIEIMWRRKQKIRNQKS